LFWKSRRYQDGGADDALELERVSTTCCTAGCVRLHFVLFLAMLQSSSHVVFDAGTACALHFLTCKENQTMASKHLPSLHCPLHHPLQRHGHCEVTPLCLRAHVVLIKAPRVLKHTRALHVELSDAAPGSQQANHVKMPPSLFIKTPRNSALCSHCPSLHLPPQQTLTLIHCRSGSSSQLVEIRGQVHMSMCLRHSILGKERKTAQASQSTIRVNRFALENILPHQNALLHGAHLSMLA
jgi:hypothetical protein